MITISTLHECQQCGALEERVLRDTWTGKDMCLECWSPIMDSLTNSPASEGDNLEALISSE